MERMLNHCGFRIFPEIRGSYAMKKLSKKTLLLLASTIILAATAVSSARALDDLIYVAVESCRIVDTREGNGLPIPKDQHINFLVSGTDSELFDQGGSQSGGCPAPKEGQKPVAIAAYVIAVPAASSIGKGVLAAYPSDKPQPPAGSASTVNFYEGQVIGNTTNITLCEADDCPADGQFAILSRNTDEHVVVDVLGYYYPLPEDGYAIRGELRNADSPGPITRGSTVKCDQGERVIGGGYDQETEVVKVIGSRPWSSEPSGWKVSYIVLKEGEWSLFAICQNDSP